MIRDMKKKSLLCVMALTWVLACPVMAANGANGDEDEDPMEVFVGKQFIDLQLKDFDGQSHRLGEYVGKGKISGHLGAVLVAKSCRSWSRCLRHSMRMALTL